MSNKYLNRTDIIHILNGLSTVTFKTLYEIYIDLDNNLYRYMKDKKSSKKELIDMLIKYYKIKPYEITNSNSILFDYLNYGKLKNSYYPITVNFFKNKKIRNCSILIKGRRNYMEDNIITTDTKNYYYSLILDGHGGDKCSIYFKLNFNKTFLKNLKYLNNYEKSIKMTLNQLENIFLKSKNESGTTLNLLFIDKKNNKYYVYNVGDSRCIALTKKNEIKILSKDHRPNLKSERDIIIKRGGFIKNNRVNGIMAVSRTFGDKKLKPIMICKPDIKKGLINDINFFVQGTDGLFDYISNREICNKIEYNKQSYYNRAIKKLLLYVYKNKKSQDNISCSFTLLA